MVKSLSKPWPPEETKTKEDGVLPEDESVGGGGKKRSRSGTPAIPGSDTGAMKEGEGKEGDGMESTGAAKASTGKDSVGNDTSVEVKKETDQNKDKSKADADGDVEMKDATEPEDVRAKKKTERRPKLRRKGLQMKVRNPVMLHQTQRMSLSSQSPRKRRTQTRRRMRQLGRRERRRRLLQPLNRRRRMKNEPN